VKKRVLLINPKLTEESTAFNVPVSLLYLGSWLNNKGYEARILDALNIKQPPTILQNIEAELPDSLCVGLSVMSAQVPNALEISKFIRQRDPYIPIIWGGVHPTLYPEQTVRSEFVDFVVKGEGEVTLCELLEVIEKQDFRPDSIRGLAFKTGNSNVTLNPERGFVDMNELPATDWNLVKALKPGSSLQEISQATANGLPILASKGCPHRCTFCINSVTKSRYRYRRTDLLLREIETIVASGVDRIWFPDENFLANRKGVREFLNGVEEKQLNFKWSTSARADHFRYSYLNSDDLSRLKKCGCETLRIGAESGSQRILDKLKKDITVEDTLNAARRLSKAGIKGGFSFMIGLPNEKEGDYKKTLQLIEKITKIDDSFTIMGPQIYRPYPGSQLYLECLRQGLKEPVSVDEWAKSPYIQLEYSRRSYYQKSLYPWVKYSGDLTSLVFYAGLVGICLRWRLVTKLVRLIGLIRCRHFYFKYPLGKRIFGLIRSGWLDRLFRQTSAEEA
jgi:anaerobic magnesium-protoporphyrin IX monomethyl ester cyclase